jgi:hypothetical protein
MGELADGSSLGGGSASELPPPLFRLGGSSSAMRSGRSGGKKNRFNNTYWEVAVFKAGFFGSFRPLFIIPNIAADEKLIREIHNSVKEFVGEHPPAKWPRGAIDYVTFSMRYTLSSVLGLNDD